MKKGFVLIALGFIFFNVAAEAVIKKSAHKPRLFVEEIDANIKRFDVMNREGDMVATFREREKAQNYVDDHLAGKHKQES